VCDALVHSALEGKVVKLNFSPESRTNALYLNLELAREAVRAIIYGKIAHIGATLALHTRLDVDVFE
jgi:hypothetical protein